MKSRDIIIALVIVLAVLIVGLYFIIQKERTSGHSTTCTMYSCGM